MSTDDPWDALRRHTRARIGVGRVGHALPTRALLDFQAAHARARDAVWSQWDVDATAAELHGAGLRTLRLASCAADRATYLRRPDLGRRLATPLEPAPCDVVLVLSDGLSAAAARAHGARLVIAIAQRLHTRRLAVAPVALVPLARVAIGDAVAEALGARLALVLVGERPGLSSADGLGAYLTFEARQGTTDERRQCVSNIREPDGLGIESAAELIVWWADAALSRQLSGVALARAVGDAVPTLGRPA